ncbi:oxidoreductase [Pilimelia anulata]|uniref:Oxidoreductase n=1 Tax=Pilimelia anulata TaxID=53371 RepID=A0A8J3BA62_9ACTN|nr:aldo/keto reductase [Pilimelia anulata]GGJ99036.1 oxidoreductase [Pilimelia anulata]
MTNPELTMGDLTVRRLGLGAMRLGRPDAWGRATDPAGGVALARLAVDLGIAFFDTADAYGLGANEELLAAALHPYPEHLVIATKAGQVRPAERTWVPLGRPEYLRQQAELSLRRLKLDRIDLFQLHRIDPRVPLSDQIGALHELRREGKIRHIGLSEVTVAQLSDAQRIAPIAAVQNRYSVHDRAHQPVLDHCASTGIAFIPWLPIGATRSLHPGVAAVARELGATPAQVALAWLLATSDVTVPIPGTSSPTHLRENAAAAALRLSPAQLAGLSRPPASAGHRAA